MSVFSRKDGLRRGSAPDPPQKAANSPQVPSRPGSLLRAPSLAKADGVAGMAQRLLVAIALDNVMHHTNGMAAVEAVLGAAADLRGPKNAGGAALLGGLLSDMTVERMQVNFRVSLLRAVLSEVYGAIEASPPVLLANARLAANLPRLFACTTEVVYSYQYFRERILATEPQRALSEGNAEVLWLGGQGGSAWDTQVAALDFARDMLRTHQLASESPGYGSSPLDVGGPSTPAPKPPHKVKGSFMDSLVDSLLPPKPGTPARGVSGGVKRADDRQIPEWVAAAQRTFMGLVNVLLCAARSGLRKQALLAPLATLDMALKEHLLLQPGAPPGLPTAGIKEPPQVPPPALWERAFLEELCGHLHGLLLHDDDGIRGAAMSVWRSLLLNRQSRPVLDQLLSVPRAKAPGAPPASPPNSPGALLKQASGLGGGGGSELMSLVVLSGRGGQPEGFQLLISGGSLEARSPRTRHGETVSGEVQFQGWLSGLDDDVRLALEASLMRSSIQPTAMRQGAMAEAWRDTRECWLQGRLLWARAGAAAVRSVEVRAKAAGKHLRVLQGVEIGRQVRWQQDRLDLAKFGARTWLEAKQRALAAGVLAVCDPRSNGSDGDAQPQPTGDWYLDFTEGPCRMRKKIVRGSESLPRRTAAVAGRAVALSIDLEEQRAELSAGLPKVSWVEVARAELDADGAEGPEGSHVESATAPMSTGRSSHNLGSESEGWSSMSKSEMSVDTESVDQGDEGDFEEGEEGAGDEGSVVTDDLELGSVGEDSASLAGPLTSPSRDRASMPAKGLYPASSFRAAEAPSAAPAPSSSSAPASPMRPAQTTGKAPSPPKPLTGPEAWLLGGSQRKPVSRKSGTSAQWEDEDNDEEEQAGPGAVDEKLRPLLQPGDDILQRYNCELVTGMDTRPGILLLCRHNLYMVENYRILQPQGGQHGTGGARDGGLGGEVVEVVERGTSFNAANYCTAQPLGSESREVYRSRSGQEPPPQRQGPSPHSCRRWPYDELVAVHRRRFLLQHVAVEAFLGDGQNFLLTLADEATREEVHAALTARLGEGSGASGPSGGDEEGLLADTQSASSGISAISSVSIASLSGALLGGKFRSPTPMTERWVNGQVSNFEYLMHLNTLAGRSYNDLTQYPVFPWIIKDYDSEELDLSDPASYRDLSRPLGALNPSRERQFRERFEILRTDEHAPPPFHYGTHYSSAAIVLYYLVRLQPFAGHHWQMQGGRFDHPNRLFHSVKGAWQASSGGDGQESTQDVKELIPEFFYLPGFLENRNGYDMGAIEPPGFGIAAAGGGTPVDHVLLPPWAKGSTREFIRIHRRALESEHVSANLHRWVDLIFGYQQQGKAAEDACNVFYYLTYEGGLDLIPDGQASTEAYMQQIHEFGQTPSQLFRYAHPPRLTAAPAASPPHAPSGSLSPGYKNRPPRPMARTARPMFGDTWGGGSASETSEDFLRTFVYQSPSLLFVTAQREVYSSAQTLLRHGRGSQPQHPALLGCLRALHLPGGAPPRPECVMGDIYCPPLPEGPSSREGPRCCAVNAGCLLIPPRCQEFLAWGFVDCSIRLCSVGSAEGGTGDGRVTASLDLSTGPVSCAAISADGRTLVAGCASGPVVDVFKMPPPPAGPRRKGGGEGLLDLMWSLVTPLHQGPIQAVAVNHAYSLAVSVCAGLCNAVLWDTARGVFVRRLLDRPLTAPPDRLRGAAVLLVEEATGCIVLGVGAALYYFDVNGDELCSLADAAGTAAREGGDGIGPVALGGEKGGAANADQHITAVCVSAGPQWEDSTVIITGHASGDVHMWRVGLGEQAGEGRRPSVDRSRGSHHHLAYRCTLPREHTAAVTALHASADQRRLYSGDSGGLLLVWGLPSGAPA